MIFTEIAERKAIQVPAVGGIAERAEICIVGRNDNGAAARGEQPMEFLDCPYNVRHMLDHVRGADLAEGAVTKGEREMIEAGDNVGPGIRTVVETNSARVLIEPAPDVENWKLAYRTRRAGRCLSSSG